MCLCEKLDEHSLISSALYDKCSDTVW